MPTISISPEDAKKLANGEDITISAKPKVWKPEKNEKYYYVDSVGSVVLGQITSVDDDSIDSNLWNAGNMFPTKEAAEAYVKYRKAVVAVTRKIQELNEGWEPDWRDKQETKYEIYFDHNADTWFIDYRAFCQVPRPFPHCRTREIAQQVIDEMETELDVIRNYSF